MSFGMQSNEKLKSFSKINGWCNTRLFAWIARLFAWNLFNFKTWSYSLQHVLKAKGTKEVEEQRSPTLYIFYFLGRSMLVIIDSMRSNDNIYRFSTLAILVVLYPNFESYYILLASLLIVQFRAVNKNGHKQLAI